MDGPAPPHDPSLLSKRNRQVPYGHQEGPAWFDELVLKPGPPWLSMGVRTLDLATWLVADDRRDAELALKDRLRTEHADEVFAARPGTEEASVEVLELVQRWMATHQPELGGPAAVPDPAAIDHPLDTAGRLVQEDLCLMLLTGGRYHLEAASLCFPSHWRLHEKLGRSLGAIHAPVPHYAEELEAKVDVFFERLRVDRPVVRRNLSIHDHDELFRPEPHESPEAYPPDPSGADRVWLRSERQTLVRLPRTGAVLFTIKTQQCPVTALAHRPDVASALAGKLRAEEPDLAARGERIAFPRWLPDWLDALPTAAR